MKFSIRDLLLLMVIVALGVGWWVDHRRQAAIVDKERAFRSRLIEIPRSALGRNGPPERYWAEAYPVGDY